MFDKGLLDLLHKNPNKAMSHIIDQYTPLVYTIVNNKLRNICSSEDIEEIVSDVFVTIYKQRDSIDLSKGSLSAYISRIARNKSVDKIRNNFKFNEISIDNDDFEIELEDKYNLENSVEMEELGNLLVSAIKELGEPDSTIVYRRYYLGQSSKEISKSMNLSHDNVRQRLSRALKKLEKSLKGESYEDFIG